MLSEMGGGVNLLLLRNIMTRLQKETSSSAQTSCQENQSVAERRLREDRGDTRPRTHTGSNHLLENAGVHDVPTGR